MSLGILCLSVVLSSCSGTTAEPFCRLEGEYKQTHPTNDDLKPRKERIGKAVCGYRVEFEDEWTVRF